jgi:hypothetical protein
VDRRACRPTRCSFPKLTITPDKGALRGLTVEPSGPFFLPRQLQLETVLIKDKRPVGGLAAIGSAPPRADSSDIFRARRASKHADRRIYLGIYPVYIFSDPANRRKQTIPRQFARLYRARPNTFSSAYRTSASHAPCLSDSAREIVLGRALFESHDELARTIPNASDRYATIAGGAVHPGSFVCIGWPSDTD